MHTETKCIHIHRRNNLLVEMKLHVSSNIKTLGNDDLMLAHFLAPRTAKFYSKLSLVRKDRISFPSINLVSVVYYV